MKKYALALVLILVIGLVAGCLGGGDETTSPSPESSPSQTEIQTTSTPSTTSPMETEPTPTETPREYTREDLLKRLGRIRQLTYVANVSILMNVTIEQGETLQKDTLNLSVVERGYLDFESWNAWINMTTTSHPDGASTNTSRVIVSNVTYVQTPLGVIKGDESLPDPVWEYNLLTLARRYLRGEPEKIERGDVTAFVYPLTGKDATTLAQLYLAISPDTEITVEWAYLVLQFKEGELIGGAISYRVTSRTEINDPSLGNMVITQEALVEEAISVESVNEKVEVKAPAT